LVKVSEMFLIPDNNAVQVILRMLVSLKLSSDVTDCKSSGILRID
jgi:hypothetical protein